MSEAILIDRGVAQDAADTFSRIVNNMNHRNDCSCLAHARSSALREAVAAAPDTAAERDRLRESKDELLQACKLARHDIKEMADSYPAQWMYVFTRLNVAIAEAESEPSQ